MIKMRKKLLISFILSIFFISSVSAAIIINQQPNLLYNIGDQISFPIKVTTATNTNDFLSILLLCNGIQTEVHKEFISLGTGEEKQVDSIIPISSSTLGIGRTTGVCTIKAILRQEYVLTNEFKISDLVTVKLNSEQKEFKPEEAIVFEGNAIKENGNGLNGVAELKIVLENSTVKTLSESVNNGYFYFNFSLPKETKAVQYLVELNAYEKDSLGFIINKGFTNFNILILQVPTSLEIVFEEQNVLPGASMKTKAVLHDQTGEKIASDVVITIKDEENIIIEQKDAKTDEFIEHTIKYNEAPANWIVHAVSNKLESEKQFTIKENAQIQVELINKTLSVKNIGNVHYNKTIKVMIGDTEKSVRIDLPVDEEKKFTMTAPDGEYKIEVLTSEGGKITGMAILKGDAVSISEPSWTAMLTTHPFVWMFVILVLGFVAYLIFKKGYRKTFIGHTPQEKEDSSKSSSRFLPVLSGSTFIRPEKTAELSLSIKGEQQDVSVISLVLKNLSEIESVKGNAKETIQKAVNIADNYKAATYENNGNIYFIFAPAFTKTFKNEETAITAAQEIRNLLVEHNKVFKQKIKFGIGVNYGQIIAKVESQSLMKFMSMGDVLTQAKRAAVASKEELIITEKIRDRVASSKLKVEKADEMPHTYKVQELREQSDENKTFLDRFKKRNDW